MAILVFEIVICRWSFALRNTFLLPIHLRNLPTTGSIIGLFIIPNLDETGKSEADSLFTGRVNSFFRPSLISWAQSQIGGLDFPNVLWFKPYIRLMLTTRGVRIERFRSINHDRRELGVKFFKNSF
jgi:hypothetical protein